MPSSSVQPLRTSWDRCWRGIGAAGDGDATCAALLAAYREPQRKYHTLQHLGECLALFDSVRELAVRPAEVEMGLWFHDAVYDVRGVDNEARSAAWANAAVSAGGVAPATALRVHALVMATQHRAVAVDADAQLLVDIDLAILGAADVRFAEYEAQIRAEYTHVPERSFKEKRAAVLRSFLQRERIFGSAHFQAQLEAQARRNLSRAVESSLGTRP